MKIVFWTLVDDVLTDFINSNTSLHDLSQNHDFYIVCSGDEAYNATMKHFGSAKIIRTENNIILKIKALIENLKNNPHYDVLVKIDAEAVIFDLPKLIKDIEKNIQINSAIGNLKKDPQKTYLRGGCYAIHRSAIDKFSEDNFKDMDKFGEDYTISKAVVDTGSILINHPLFELGSIYLEKYPVWHPLKEIDGIGGIIMKFNLFKDVVSNKSKKERAIVFGLNNNAFTPVCAMLNSLKSNVTVPYDLIALYNDLHPDNVRILRNNFKCEMSYYDDFVNLKENYPQFSDLTFARYECFRLLKQYKQVLWLDADIIIRRNIDTLFDNKYPMHVVYETATLNNNFIGDIPFVTPDHYKENYFNAGVMLLNNCLIRSLDIYEWCKKNTLSMLGCLKFPDQGILNLLPYVFDFKPHALNPEYNAVEEYIRKIENPVIVHFAHPVKPWKEMLKAESKFGKYVEEWRYWCSKKIEGVKIMETSVCPNTNNVKITKENLKILLISDIPGWAFNRKSISIKKYLPEYNITHIVNFSKGDWWKNRSYESSFPQNSDDGYNVVLFYLWYSYKDCLPFLLHKWEKRPKILVGISSRFETGDEKRFLSIVGDADAVFANNIPSFHQFNSRIKNLFYCPNGVDIDDFKEITPIDINKKNLIVGFAGNSQSPGKKGLYDFILPAVQGVENVELNFLDPIIGKRMELESMINFYNSIDCYLCASDNEGTPNPCLESAACGRPLITTQVGNMPELVVDNLNSFFIERSIKAIQEKLIYYRDNRNILIEHGQRIKQDIISKWSWKHRVSSYKKMFDSLIP